MQNACGFQELHTKRITDWQIFLRLNPVQTFVITLEVGARCKILGVSILIMG